MVSRVSLSQIAPRYDAFLIDNFGVIKRKHGVRPNAKAAIERLRGQGKKVVLFSNTGCSTEIDIQQAFAKGGLIFSPDDMVTSGGALGIAFRQWQLIGKQVISVGKPETEEYVRRAGARVTKELSSADAAVFGGFLHRTNLSQFWLAVTLGRKTDKPVITLNPDLFVPGDDGEKAMAPGQTGLRYEEASGKKPLVVGKPEKFMYELAFEQHLQGIPKERVLAIGDSLDHDILGANRFGIDSLLVLSGLEAPGFWQESLEQRMIHLNATPTYIADELTF